jgi:hypothetical protein
MTPDDFNAPFDQFRSTAFRLETLQRYTVAEEVERIEAFRRAAPRPDRSVRTSQWLRRIAVTTAAGRRWSRARLVELPPSEYVRYQLRGYVESAACGEEIRLAIADDRPELQVAAKTGDFWLFDGGTSSANAIALHYDQAGRPTGNELITDPQALGHMEELRTRVWEAAEPLNAFLARS